MSLSFRDNLIVVPNKQHEVKAAKIDAYKTFVSEAVCGYVMFMELINQIVTKLEDNGIIGKTKVKGRIKSINSSMNNTEEKILDDIFGFEIVTQNEKDKEILMVVIHNLFDEKYARHKNHNKSNGYYAHHCTGSVKKNLDEKEDLERHILEAKTYELKTEYRDMTHKEQKKHKKDEIFCQKPRYPILRKEILERNNVDNNLKKNLEDTIEFAIRSLQNNPEAKRALPIMEMQFKTVDVEKEAKYGKAQHVKYKEVKEEEILGAYKNRKLVRGVDFPFTFTRNDNRNMEIEHSNETLTTMWPFLNNAIMEYHKTHKSSIQNYDMYFVKIFPELEPYIIRNTLKEPSLQVDGYNEEMAWGLLKNKILNNSFVLPEMDENLIKSVNWDGSL